MVEDHEECLARLLAPRDRLVESDVLELGTDRDDALMRLIGKTRVERPALETDRNLDFARSLEQELKCRVLFAVVADVDPAQLLTRADRFGDRMNPVDDVVEVDIGAPTPGIYPSTLHDVPSRESLMTMRCAASASRKRSASAKSFDWRARRCGQR